MADGDRQQEAAGGERWQVSCRERMFGAGAVKQQKLGFV